MIGIIGGTGPQGKGLAYRLADGGVDVLVGSRDDARGQAVAEEITAMGPAGRVTGAANGALPGRCEQLIIAVPHEGLVDTLAPLAQAVDGHVVMSAVNNLGFLGGPHLVQVDAGSSAQEIAALLPGARVTTAFNNVSAVHLIDPGWTFDEDVLVCGDDADAVRATCRAIDAVTGMRGIPAGPLRHAATVEAMTAVLISINKANKVNAGLRITGL